MAEQRELWDIVSGWYQLVYVMLGVQILSPTYTLALNEWQQIASFLDLANAKRNHVLEQNGKTESGLSYPQTLDTGTFGFEHRVLILCKVLSVKPLLEFLRKELTQTAV